MFYIFVFFFQPCTISPILAFQKIDLRRWVFRELTCQLLNMEQELFREAVESLKYHLRRSSLFSLLDGN